MPPKKKGSGKEKIAPISAKKLIKLFNLVGYIVIGRSGSHVTLKKSGNPLLITIPDHKGQDIRPPLVRALIRNAGITRKRYFDLLMDI